MISDYLPASHNQSQINIKAVLPTSMTNKSASNSGVSRGVSESSDQKQFANFNFHHKPISKRVSQNSSIVEAMLEKQSNESAASKAILIESAFKKQQPIIGEVMVKKTAPLTENHETLIQTPTKYKRE